MKKEKTNKKYYIFALAVVLVGITGFLAGSTTAQTGNVQSHPASEISPGTFTAGDYYFAHWSRIIGENRLDVAAKDLMLVSTEGHVKVRLNTDGQHPGSLFAIGVGSMDASAPLQYKDVFSVNQQGIVTSTGGRMLLLGKDGANMFWFMDGTAEGTNNVLGINAAEHSIEIPKLKIAGNSVKKSYLNRCYSDSVKDHLYYVTASEDKGCEGSLNYKFEQSYKIVTWE